MAPRKSDQKPKSVYLSPFNYTIEWTKSKGTSAHGETSLEQKEITINNVGSDDVVRETLNHEICHVLLEDIIDVLLHTDLKSEDAEELMVRLLSPRLFEFIRKNPEVIKYIQGE